MSEAVIQLRTVTGMQLLLNIVWMYYILYIRLCMYVALVYIHTFIIIYTVRILQAVGNTQVHWPAFALGLNMFKIERTGGNILETSRRVLPVSGGESEPGRVWKGLSDPFRPGFIFCVQCVQCGFQYYMSIYVQCFELTWIFRLIDAILSHFSWCCRLGSWGKGMTPWLTE